MRIGSDIVTSCSGIEWRPTAAPINPRIRHKESHWPVPEVISGGHNLHLVWAHDLDRAWAVQSARPGRHPGRRFGRSCGRGRMSCAAGVISKKSHPKHLGWLLMGCGELLSEAFGDGQQVVLRDLGTLLVGAYEVQHAAVTPGEVLDRSCGIP